MDAYEATRIVFSRIQSLDPENASKIMGLLLIQDHGEKEIIRLAFGPEALVHSVVLKARKELGLSSNTPSTPSTPSSPSPFLSSSSNSSVFRQDSSSRMLGGGLSLAHSLSVQSSPSLSSSWTASAFSDIPNQDDLVSPGSSSSASYSAGINGINNMVVGSPPASSLLATASASPFYGGGSDLIDELQLQDQLSFLNDASPTHGLKNAADMFYPQSESASGTSDSMIFPSYAAAAASWGASINGHHRRSCSVTDVLVSDAGAGFGWKPCLYFARGYCKNGTSCRFLHGLPDSPTAVSDTASLVGSSGKLDIVEQCQELLRSKAAAQQRLGTVSQLMASPPFPFTTPADGTGKCMNFLLQQQQNDSIQRAAATMMMSEDVHKFVRPRLERTEFSTTNGGGMASPGSRQIYLTFPADSTFREEDVSNYFSIYGPVQDVRIPYQQKRMFGFVTFVYPETVKLILAKGNPHFVCDARVLVKPYKEKGKVPDKKQQQQQQQTDGGGFSTCTTPTSLDSGDAYELQLGAARMFYNTQDVLLRRKLEEQADLQQAIELQGRRLMGLHLFEVKKHHHRTMSAGPPVSSTHSYVNQSLVLPSDCSSSPETPDENCVSPATSISAAATTAAPADQQSQQQALNSHEESSENKEVIRDVEDSDFQDGVEHNLPDSPFASPTKSAGDHSSFFSAQEAERSIAASASSSSSTSSPLPTTSSLDITSFKSCFFQVPRFSSGHGAIGL
ncbi:PREDICTED: zinc finger CCCH domain-containing protein 53-like isoform X2 [Nelumbo nucifera]|uniref:Zinc finger CCCH domain-containing protein 53-like isoform X2 n=1 Tax=Nelumbo nucifera TaxID=4432 RepID=A0A1U8BHM9_NELNU|nr:PREDICTED: zinc finger CCCH domain-containing protein 53-like isoform X2 [Nelumbo nucifera]